MTPWLWRVPLLLAAVWSYASAALSWNRAMMPGNLTPSGERSFFTLLWLGPHASRRNFTDEGWALQSRALRRVRAGFACLVVLLFTW
jgi:hypothetical protein